MTKQEALKLLLKYHGEEKVSGALLYIDSAIDEALKQQREEIREMIKKNGEQNGIIGIETKHKEGFKSWESNQDMADGYKKCTDDTLKAIQNHD